MEQAFATPLDANPALQVDTWLPQRRSLRVAVVTETYPPEVNGVAATCLLYTSPSPRDGLLSRMPSSA